MLARMKKVVAVGLEWEGELWRRHNHGTSYSSSTLQGPVRARPGGKPKICSNVMNYQYQYASNCAVIGKAMSPCQTYNNSEATQCCTVNIPQSCLEKRSVMLPD